MIKTEIKLPESYFKGGNAREKGSSKEIKVTNERVQNAVYHNGIVYGVFCTDVENEGYHGLYLVKIDARNKKGESFIYKEPQTDLINPAMTLLPTEEKGQMRVAIGYQEANINSYASLKAIVCDEYGKWTTPLMVKKGVESMMSGRWGDYLSCVTRLDGEPTFWISGQYGGKGNRENWIAEVKVSDNELINDKFMGINLAPNPAREHCSIAFNMLLDVEGHISIYTIEGKWVKQLYYGVLKAGINELCFDTTPLSPGGYVISVVDVHGRLLTEKFIKK